MPALRLPPLQAAWAQAAADLVNTRPRETDPLEKLDSVEALERLPLPEPPPAPWRAADVDGMRALRAPLLAAFEAPDETAFAAALNPLLGRGAWALVAAAEGWQLAPGGAAAVDWYSARAARGLAELVLAHGLGRLHVCAAGDCLRAVADVSRNGSRRYCSRRCATRMNVRRHRAAR